MAHTYPYARPAVTVDVAVFALDEQDLQVMLIQRGLAPFAGQWALPGGFVRVEETLDEAAARELAEESGLTNIFLEQLYTFGSLQRDPRERVVTVAYYALVNLAVWNKLGAERQKILHEAMAVVEAKAGERVQLDAAERKRQEAAGIKTIQLPPAEARKWSDTAKEAGWAAAMKTSPEAVAKLKELLTKK